MALAESGEKRVLLTGDGRGHHLTSAMKDLGLLDQNAPLHVHVLKMPHHGSERNVKPELFDMITDDRYVFSANGKDGNPDLATLVMLVENAQSAGREIELIVTNATPSTQAIVARHPPSDFQYRLTTMPAGEHVPSIDLAP